MRAHSLSTLALGALLLASGCQRSETHPSHQEEPPGAAAADIAHWTCSMHPSVRQSGPGKCPICSMDLIPVSKEELASGELVLPAEQREHLGIAFSTVEPRRFGKRIRALGKVAFDESRLTDVTVRVGGYVEQLFAKTVGEPVAAGAPLVTILSPDLIAAQEELLAAVTSQRAARATAAPDRADYLVEAARQRLKIWGMTAEAIEAVQRTGRPMERLTVTAPVVGLVLERMVVEGGAVEPGMRLFRLVGVDRVWIEAEVYEADAASLKVGQRAEIELPHRPGGKLASRVSFLYPALDPATRTVKARMELPRGGFELRPETFANVEIEVELGERLAVPAEAVLYTGERRVVFVDLGQDRLEPRAIETGMEEGGFLEVVSGLVAGERVVSSGIFLVAAESRLKQGLLLHDPEPQP